MAVLSSRLAVSGKLTLSGIYDYKVLPPAGSKVVEDKTLVASYSYNSATKELISYDTPDIAKMKADYIVKKGLAGAMFWELSGDKTGSDSLVRTTAQNMGGLDNTPNHIYYPYSQFDNIKNNLGLGGASASPTYVLPTSTSTPSSTRTSSSTSTSAVPTLGTSTLSTSSSSILSTSSSSTTTSSSATSTSTSSPAPTTSSAPTSNPITIPTPTTTTGAVSDTTTPTGTTTSIVWTPTPQPGDLCRALRLWDPAKAGTSYLLNLAYQMGLPCHRLHLGFNIGQYGSNSRRYDQPLDDYRTMLIELTHAPALHGFRI
ncbi:hypothetical protein FRC10_004999 [Ceratobasidium sp. 414]|nr:hypothetical protein FRC10_004999 [Ceratobasidium sp. 414]